MIGEQRSASFMWHYFIFVHFLRLLASSHLTICLAFNIFQGKLTSSTKTSFNELRILLKQNTAVLSTFRPYHLDHLDHLDQWTTWTIWTSCTTSTTLTDQTTLTILTDQWLIKKIIAESALFTWSCYPYHPLFVNKSREGINNKASQNKIFRLSSSVFLDPFCIASFEMCNLKWSRRTLNSVCAIEKIYNGWWRSR